MKLPGNHVLVFMKNRLAWLLVVTVLFWSCISAEKKASDEYAYFLPGRVQGILDNIAIDEASGLVASRVNAGMLWTHNDSGDKARLFLIDTLGRHQATLKLKGILNRDWEDIAAGPGPDSTKTYLYIGEIGDNDAQYKYKIIYRIEEPLVKKEEMSISSIDSIRFTLPDGSRDAEALMIDPLSRDLYIFSKRENAINLYRLPYPQSVSEMTEAELVIDGLPFTLVVAADWSADGREILIKTYKKVFYWQRKPGEPVAESLRRTPAELPYREEPQGESIAFDGNGNGYFTVSEKFRKQSPELIYYPRATAKP